MSVGQALLGQAGPHQQLSGFFEAFCARSKLCNHRRPTVALNLRELHHA
eukprot:COSAG04_NODE_19749_length_409_cov_0.667742_1_plen_48_part_10